MKKLNHEENQFLDRLVDRELPEPEETSRKAILAHAAARVEKAASTPVHRSPSIDRSKRYQQLVAGVLAVSVVFILLGIGWSNMFNKEPDSARANRQDLANSPLKGTQGGVSEKDTEDTLAQIAIDEIRIRRAIHSANQRIDSFWRHDASWQPFRSTASIDRQLIKLRYRVKQLKKRSEIDVLLKSQTKEDKNGQLGYQEKYCRL